ncbi:MAG: arginase family protein [Nanoarchaeota archaeon]
MRIYLAESRTQLLNLLSPYELNESGTPVHIEPTIIDAALVHPAYPAILLGESPQSFLTDFPKGGIVSFSARLSPAITPFAQNAICIGLRDLKRKDRTALIQSRINAFSMKEISFTSLREACDSIMAAARQWEALLIHVNLDVLDSSIIPKSPCGGMTTRELIYFLQRLRILKNFRMAQVIPDKNDDVLAKLVIELL